MTLDTTNRDSKLTADYDEKLESVSDGSHPTTDAEQALEEKRLVRKLDSRILPIACLLYLFACMFAFFTSFTRYPDPSLLRP